jgi:hypothetical protein
LSRSQATALVKEIAMKPTVYVPALAIATLAACSSYSPVSSPNPPEPLHASFTTQGDSANVAAKLDEFRTALGGDLHPPNTPPASSGRREINWDGVPAALTNVDTFPANFFNTTSKRGAIFVTPGTGFRVDSTDFADLNAALGDQFKFFSPKKLFVSVGSKRVEVDFELVGTTAPALVRGFGVIFSDVDRDGSTLVDFFDASNVRIARINAPAHLGSHEFSFVGAVFDSAIVAKVQITSGDAPLNAAAVDISAGGPADLVSMDDFAYGEPQPIP